MPRQPEWEPIVWAKDHNSAVLSRATDRGNLVLLGRGIYSGIVDQEPAQVVREHHWELIAGLFPDAVLVDRSARDAAVDLRAVFVAHPRQRPVHLPGMSIYPRRGPGAQHGDTSLPSGIWIASRPRALLENLVEPRANAKIRRTLTRVELEEWIDHLARHDGDDRLNHYRDQARELAPVLGLEKQFEQLDKLISAALQTHDMTLEPPVLRARATGQSYDPHRVETFDMLADTLATLPPITLPVLAEDQDRRALLPFYEAYFSNFIEGTEFTTDEAADIVFNGRVPEDRPEDAHDVLGTYRLVDDDAEMSRAPRDPGQFIDLMRGRHAILMEARPDVHPGRFKERDNRAGGTVFVAHALVAGTLRAGLAIRERVTGPFARALYTMFLVTEVHPFTDGNGRIARIMMNCELFAAGDSRIIIPTVYRNNYLSALRGATHNANFEGLVAMLAYAQRWTARVNFTSRATAEADLETTNALRDAAGAENSGIRLILP